MQNFPEPTDLGHGFAWTATLDGHDYWRLFNFYFTLSVYRDGALIGQLPVETFDYSYGDVNCTYTDDEVRANVRRHLHDAAREYLAAQLPPERESL
jgi:hypothetical protein